MKPYIQKVEADSTKTEFVPSNRNDVLIIFHIFISQYLKQLDHLILFEHQ